ncbi:uncharacterized protein LOC130655492 isoform X1 [Hydractinia symbiolongicarpus]|uniref:uncharacterized protein LOC130655492 isoform X1 n=1 Tax=Hydractinia symbiolongicarpus TaxID=13093 RepID=UPI0025502E0B|nr:uncharacterized protein LOC130655492 isoform X1 [Hydractinia symbiolongicarpus]
MKGRILVYSIVGCPFCIRAKGYLEQLGLPYIDVNLDKNSAARQFVIERTGKKTVPQIFFNELHIGGWDDLNKMPKEELNRWIKLVEENVPPENAPKPPAVVEEEESADPFDFQCELDEYGELVKELRDSGIVKEHKRNLKTYKNSFIGKEAVDWLVKNKDLDRDAAISMCRQLVERHFGHSVKKESYFKDDNSIYRFIEDDEGKALNAGIHTQCEPRPGKRKGSIRYILIISKVLLHIFCDLITGFWRFLQNQRFFLYIPINSEIAVESKLNLPHAQASDLGEELRQLILSIYNSHLSPDGKKVDYKTIGETSKFKAYVQRTGELHRVNVEGATRKEKLAFFINIYNALVIHAFVTIGPPVNLWQRYKFFNTVSYVIGGYNYSLNDIENGILRSNRKPIGSLKKPFSKSDPRLKVSLAEPEPKIHFALVCGAKSCPPIKTYSAGDVDNQLKLAAESFLEGDGCIVDMKKKEVCVSQILKWYKEDFGSNKQQIVQFVHDNMGACEKKTQLAELLKSSNFKLNHIPYDWGINSK